MMTKERLTVFGKYLRKLRIENNVSIKDMSDRLEISTAYLSAVETGKRKIPKDWRGKIINLFNLSEVEQTILSDIIYNSRDELGKLKSDRDSLKSRCEKSEAERDALIEAIENFRICSTCSNKKYSSICGCCCNYHNYDFDYDCVVKGGGGE